MNGLTFRQLEVFVQIVERGGTSACADQLGISQTSVSEHLKALEHHCGSILIHRGRGVPSTLTEAGEQTYVKARELLAQADELTSAFNSNVRGGTKRKVRFAANEYIMERIGSCLANFTQLYATVDLEHEQRPFEGVLQGLKDGDLEFGLFLSFGPVAELESFCAWQEEVGFYVGRDHPLANAGPLDIGELGDFPFVHLPIRTHLRRQIDALLRSAGLVESQNSWTGESYSFLIEMLSQGMGVACLFTEPTDAMPSRSHLSRLVLTKPLPMFDVRCAIRSPFHRDRLVTRLAAQLADVRNAASRIDRGWLATSSTN